jgi:aspartate/methionine/tyrosine aminotransferase
LSYNTAVETRASIEQFDMERMQCTYEHMVDFNLSESGVHALTMQALLQDEEDVLRLLAMELSYPMSPGSDTLRERIASWYQGATMDNVTVTNGGAEANFLTAWSLLGKGNRLALMLPNYMQVWGLGRYFADGVDPLVLQSQLTPEGHRRWGLDTAALAESVTDKTGVIWVCNPNNPTGGILSSEEMDAVIDAADRVGAWIVSDEIYRGAEVRNSKTTASFWGLYPKTVITSGLSKAFGLPGLRLGWYVAAEGMVEELWRHRDYTTIMASRLSDELALRAMDPPRREQILSRTRQIIDANIGVVDAWASANQDIVRYVPPEAGAIAYFEYDLEMDSVSLCEQIRVSEDVLVVPGAYLGLERGFRVGFGHDAAKTDEGLRRIERVLRRLQGSIPSRAAG